MVPIRKIYAERHADSSETCTRGRLPASASVLHGLDKILRSWSVQRTVVQEQTLPILQGKVGEHQVRTNEDDLHEAVKRHSMKISTGDRCAEEKRSDFNSKSCKPIPQNDRKCQKKKRASEKIVPCPKCSEEKQSSDFWHWDLTHKNRSNFGCKTCNPIPPSERIGQKRKIICKFCGEMRICADFWPVDWAHKSRPKVGCKACNPIPPSERLRGPANVHCNADPEMNVP